VAFSNYFDQAMVIDDGVGPSVPSDNEVIKKGKTKELKCICSFIVFALESYLTVPHLF